MTWPRVAAEDALQESSGATLLSVASTARPPHAFPAFTAAGWARLLEAAEFHGLTPLLYQCSRGTSEPVPCDVADALAAAYLASAKRGLAQAAWLSETVAVFGAAGIPMIALKGPALAQILYPDPALRPSSDLDVLVHPSDLQRTLHVLAGEGYVPPPHLARFPARILVRLDCELTLQHPRRASIDLHWDTAPADYPFRIDAGLLWHARDSVQVAGRSVPVLRRECLLLYLATHAAKHGWWRLLWLSDIARVLEAPLDWTAATRLAAESGCARVVRVALLLAHDLLGAPVPADVMLEARADAPVSRVAAEVSERLRRLPPRELSSVQLTAFNARLATGLSAKARHWAALAITPQEADLVRWRLPYQLRWFYRPLRMQRLIRKYARKFLVPRFRSTGVSGPA
jgi:hypothetical protein